METCCCPVGVFLWGMEYSGGVNALLFFLCSCFLDGDLVYFPHLSGPDYFPRVFDYTTVVVH